MRPLGRRSVALVGLLGTMALSLCVTAAGFADTIKSELELTTKEVSSKESALGNLVADAVKALAKTDAAFVPALAFNEVTLPKGNVNSDDLLKALAYKTDTVVIVKLTGDQITKAMEHSLYLYPKSNSGFLQFSGLTVTINPDAEKEKRVLSIKIGGSALETGKTYKVAMPSPLAKGALVYFKIWKPENIEKDTQKTLETAVTSYLGEHKTVTKGEERLVIKGKKE